jgi:hypothetical protein
MKLFRVNYEIKGNKGQSFTAGIIANSKEKAIDMIYRKVGVSIRVLSIGMGGDVNAIDDEIADIIIKKSGEVEKLKKKVKNLTNELKNLETQYESDVAHYQERLDAKEQQDTQSVSSAALRDAMRANQAKQPQVEEKIIEKKLYICPYCEFETEKKQGLKTHIARMHKDN